MKLLFLTLLFTIHSLIYAQTACNIKDRYGDFIKVKKEQYEKKEYIVQRIVKTGNSKCFGTLIDSNLIYIDYLLVNYSQRQPQEEYLKMKDSVALQKKYIHALKEDSLFNAVMLEFTEKTIGKIKSKDTVSMDLLLNVAVKYFSILKLNDDGNFVGKVCVGLNDIKKTEKERHPQIEAFCFAAIIKNYKGSKYSMYDEFIKNFWTLNSVNLGIDPHEKLLRAQGGMYFLMRNNSKLKEMLMDEYEGNKNNLPFIVKMDK